MKGQTINIDWSIGLSLFLVTILSSVVFLIDPMSIQDNRAMENKAVEVQDILQQELGYTSMRNTFYTRSPAGIENIPYIRSYNYIYEIGDGASEKHSYINVGNDRFATVLDSGNKSLDFLYYDGEFNQTNRYSDLSTGSGTIGNSYITIQYSSDVDSAEINGREAIKNISIDGSGSSSNDIYATAFGGNLKVFNGSREFMIDDSSIVMYTRNYSTLYWHPDGEQNLDTEGKNGSTQGLTVADSDLGVTLMGDLEADVKKTANDLVRIEVDAPRTRVRLHESGTGYGEKRIESFTASNEFFGVEKHFESFFFDQKDSLSDMDENEFESRFRLDGWGYNITVTPEGDDRILSRGDRIAFRQTVVSTRQSSFVSEKGRIKQAETKVVIWR